MYKILKTVAAFRSRKNYFKTSDINKSLPLGGRGKSNTGIF